jgi:hypothetical protein
MINLNNGGGPCLQGPTGPTEAAGTLLNFAFLVPRDGAIT